jgi:hypothetical protein
VREWSDDRTLVRSGIGTTLGSRVRIGVGNDEGSRTCRL